MWNKRRFLGALAAGPWFFAWPVAFGQSAPAGWRLRFRGVDYAHRWSRQGQNEFTPEDQADLSSWQDMLTINVHAHVRTEAQLASLAQGVRRNYQMAGNVLRAVTRPGTESSPTEHLLVAVMGNPQVLEAAFARFKVVDEVALVLVYSHRTYGPGAEPAMVQWLRANGQGVEDALMAWTGWPSVAALQALPQSE